jgi:integrase/recombinase XerC
MTFNSDIDNYLEALRTQRKLSPHTLSSYGGDLVTLAGFAAASGTSPGPEQVTHFHIRKLASQLHAQGLSPRSIARKLSAWRGFFGWLAEQGRPLERNPVDGVRAPRRAKSLPKALSPDDAIRLVGQATPGRDPADVQQLCNRAMFELLYSSGLRVSELAGLDLRYAQQGGYRSLGWLDDQLAEVTVTGKGNKMRTVPVGAHASQALRAWLQARVAPATTAEQEHQCALFLNSRGRRIRPELVQKRIKAHGLALGIPANVHPHVMRHSFASHLLQSSGDLRAVQEMLGHASIASTQVYTSLDFQRLATVYDAAHPRAKKRSEPA